MGAEAEGWMDGWTDGQYSPSFPTPLSQTTPARLSPPVDPGSGAEDVRVRKATPKSFELRSNSTLDSGVARPRRRDRRLTADRRPGSFQCQPASPLHIQHHRCSLRPPTQSVPVLRAGDPVRSHVGGFTSECTDFSLSLSLSQPESLWSVSLLRSD